LIIKIFSLIITINQFIHILTEQKPSFAATVAALYHAAPISGRGWMLVAAWVAYVFAVLAWLSHETTLNSWICQTLR
jgi:hypothetical protein